MRELEVKRPGVREPEVREPEARKPEAKELGALHRRLGAISLQSHSNMR